MADATSVEPEPLYPAPRPLTPLWPRRWAGFPGPLPPLIGREREVALLCDLLGEPWRRLVTVTGPGGVGKTRLALAAATEVGGAFADGAAFVPLAAIDDPTLILPTIARVLEVRESLDRPLRETLSSALRERRLLLVLDNFEHLDGAAAAGDIAALLAACPGLTVLVTSRTPLRLHDEQLFATPTLALPPASASAPGALTDYGAVALFVERARMADHAFALSAENAAAVVEVCRRLDGLPLAIELAAAWTRLLPPAALVRRLERRLPLLEGGGDDQPARLRTMRNAIAWSYDLLSAEEARFFRRLSVFVGGFTLEVAGDVGGDASPFAFDLLAALVDKSLLQVAAAVADEPRYLMLETVREFALELLAESGETERTAAAHATSMRDLVERAEPHMVGPDERHWRARLDAELGNIRAALTWGLEHDVETALRIGAALWTHWTWNLVPEGRRWLTAALNRTSDEPVLIRTRAQTTHAALALLAGDVAEGVVSGDRAVALAVAAGDPIAEGLARWVAACCYVYDGSAEPAVAGLERALSLLAHATTTKNRAQAAYARWTHAIVEFTLGEHEQAILHYEEALAQVRVAGSPAMGITILSDFAGSLVDLGNLPGATALVREALRLAVDYGDSFFMAVPLTVLALVDAQEGNAVPAARQLGAVEAVFVRMGMAMPVPWQQRIDRATALARQTLGADAFAAAWEAGHADPTAVLAEALAHTDAIGSAASDAAAAPFHLTLRERDVLALLVAGRSDREIARALFISPRTASNHVGSIRRKLKVGTRAEAAVRAVRDGLVEPAPEP